MEKTNFDLLMDTINMLKYSQGFYSRLARQVEELSEEELAEVKQKFNDLPQFKDTLDVVMYLET